MNKRCNIAVLIVAGGNSSRMGGDIPKQYLKLKDKAIIEITIGKFLKNENISKVICVIGKNHEEYFSEISQSLDIQHCYGGETRQSSVRKGLEFLENLEEKYSHVLIHDAARPFITGKIINDVIGVLRSGENSVLPTLKVKDTVKHIVEDEYADKTEDRDKLVLAQTPQGFDFDFILGLHQKYKDENLTDDCSLVETSGKKSKLVDGSESNFKITTKEDYERAIQIFENTKLNQIENEMNEICNIQTENIIRVGNGFDVHAFEEGDHVIICGIKIPHDRSLKGHSDADVGMHAITDAILGAAGFGDIGEHFSDKDDKWKNCNSEVFLDHSAKILAAEGGYINNVDLTIICEEPKLSNYKIKMKENVARILKISINAVNIKATTTEKLGYLGRREGVAALANVAITMPK